ncbi:MAG: divalent-cation tolerance protein CutA [Acidobacteriota bacterium]
MAEKGLVVLSTAAETEVARNLAAMLVKERLAACANVVDGIHSVYWWEGEVRSDAEVLLIIKTDADHLERLTAALEQHHPYDCPEVIALPVVGGSAAYLDWLRQSLDRSD